MYYTIFNVFYITMNNYEAQTNSEKKENAKISNQFCCLGQQKHE